MTTLTVQVSANTNDADLYNYSTTRNFYTSLGQAHYAGSYDSLYMKFGCCLRFTGITIPKGATITSAKIQVCASNPYSSDNAALQWYSHLQMQDADNPAALSDLTDWDSRTLYSSRIDWNGSSAWSTDSWHDSPDIASLIQHIVDRSGWSSGNAIVIAWHDWDHDSADARNRRAVYDYEASSSKAPKLVIEYQGALAISPTAIASAEAFGSPKLTFNIAPSGISSAEAFGSPTIAHVVLSIAPTGIPTAEVFGTPSIKYPQTISPSGIPSAQAFGTPGLYQGIIRPAGIPSAEAFGVPVIARYGVHVILEAEYFEESPEVNRAFVVGRDASGFTVSASALTSSEVALVGERLEVTHNSAIPTSTVAGNVAAAILEKLRLDGRQAEITISPHCGVELWDVIDIIDELCDQSADYRVMGYTFEYDSKQAVYQHNLKLCSV